MKTLVIDWKKICLLSKKHITDKWLILKIPNKHLKLNKKKIPNWKPVQRLDSSPKETNKMAKSMQKSVQDHMLLKNDKVKQIDSNIFLYLWETLKSKVVITLEAGENGE